MSEKPACPGCKSCDVRKHGQHLGKQRWYCKSCGLAFTGDVYKRRPENEFRLILHQNEKLLRLIKIALFMRKAQNEYLMKPCSKTFLRKQVREARFDKLAAKIVSENEAEKTGEEHGNS
jgi:transposase-like protein